MNSLLGQDIWCGMKDVTLIESSILEPGQIVTYKVEILGPVIIAAPDAFKRLTILLADWPKILKPWKPSWKKPRRVSAQVVKNGKFILGYANRDIQAGELVTWDEKRGEVGDAPCES